MRVRAWRRHMLAACFLGLLTMGAVACAETPEVVIRPNADGFAVIGQIGDKTHFYLLNDSDRDLDVQVVALNGHSITELRDEVGGGDLPEWATSIGNLQAVAGEAADAELDTGDGSFAVIELGGDAPLVANLPREAEEGRGEAPEGGEGGGETPAVEVPALPAAGPVGSGSGTVNVTMSEFSVEAAPGSTTSGQIVFNLNNEGAVLHELLIIRTEAAQDALPIKSGAVDEANPGLDVVGEILNVNGGDSGNVTAPLPAGNYVLLCNIPGHYNAGMHTAFTVQ